MKNKVFTKSLKVKGNLYSSFCFENENERSNFIKNEIPKLEKTHGKLELFKEDLEGLKIGDKCHVWGDGDEEYIIEGIKKYSDHRYGFALSSGFFEEIVKCYKVSEY